MYKSLIDYVEEENILYEEQFGFRSNPIRLFKPVFYLLKIFKKQYRKGFIHVASF